MKRIESMFNSHPKMKRMIWILLMVFIMSFEYFMIQFSTNHSITKFISQPLLSKLINVCIVFTLNLWVYLFTKNWLRALTITSVLFFGWCIADYYTVQYHGGPLFISELSNFKTAMNVMSGLRFQITSITIYLIIGLLILLGCVYVLKRFYGKDYIQVSRWKKLGLVLLSTAFIFVTHFGPLAYKPRAAMQWDWNIATAQYGIGSILIEDVDKMINYMKQPEGYDPKEIDKIAVQTFDSVDQKPDIILILNETFYDLNEYGDFEADVDPLEDFYNIPGAKYGHAVVPGVSGGTNDSEYELLTSHSMYLLNSHAPFNYMNLGDTTNNVQILEQLGYQSAGMHSYWQANYKRYMAYPQLGFDDTLLYPDYFELSSYGNRMMTDASNYQNMMDHYNNMSKDPRFLYFLTYQNHCGWDLNDASLDTVHVKKDYGNMTDDINEYLTSIQMSAQSFRELVDTYNQQDRPVIICMLGDHCPNILNFVDGEIQDVQQSDYVKKKTPLVVWSNIELQDVNLDAVSTHAVIPTLMKMAGLPMSTYQNEIYELTQEKGVLTSDGYLVEDNTFSSFSEKSVYDQVKDYYYMEYNDLKYKQDHREDLFVVKEK